MSEDNLLQDDSESEDSRAVSEDPIKWELLHDYLRSLPTRVTLTNDCESVEIERNYNSRSYHKVYELHNLVIRAVRCDPLQSKACEFLKKIIEENIWQILNINLKEIVNLSDNLSFTRNGLEVTINISPSLIQLLQEAVDEKYNAKQNNRKITITISHKQDGKVDQSQVNQLSTDVPHDVASFSHNVSDIQALLALVVAIKCYPAGWKRYFFWDAWLAVTIQFGLLRKVDSDNDKEVFPGLWMKQVFLAERLVGIPDRIKCLIMGQDPVCRVKSYQGIHLSNLRSATGIAFHNIGDEHPSIAGMRKNYRLDCKGKEPMQHCKDGKVLVNMIRCIPKDSKSMTGNPYYDAWFVYSLKLAKYCGEHNKPVVVMCNRKYEPNLVKCIQIVNDKAKRVEHPAMNVSPKDQKTFIDLVL